MDGAASRQGVDRAQLLPRLRIGTLNVHSWATAEWRRNTRDVCQLLKEHKVDIVGLQEVGGSGGGRGGRKARRANTADLQTVAGKLGFHSTAHTCADASWGCHMISRYPIVRVELLDSVGNGTDGTDGSRKRKHRMILATVALAEGFHVDIATVHLDHMYEPRRMRQLDTILDSLRRRRELLGASAARAPLVVVGDFNALTRADYSQAEWDEIARVRRRGNWEPPLSEVTARMTDAGMTDCWRAAGCVGCKRSCRFDTRIDYVWVDSSVLRRWAVVGCRIHEDDLSDHNLVVAELVPRETGARSSLALR